MSREFDLGDVLSISDGRLVSTRHMDGVYDILNYMTGDNLTTIGLLSAMPPCKSALLEQYPRLAATHEDATKLTPETFVAWLDSWKAQFGEALSGEALSVEPLASWERRTTDSDVADVMARNPKAQILTVDSSAGV